MCTGIYISYTKTHVVRLMHMQTKIACLPISFFFFFPERERGRERVQTGEGQREKGERQSQAGSVLCAEPYVGLNPTNCKIMT